MLSTVKIIGEQQRSDPLLHAQYRNDVNRHGENVKNGLLLPWFIDAARYWT